MRWKMLRFWLIGLVALLVVVGICLVMGTYKEEEICTVCGQTQVVRHVQIPRTSITLFSFTTVSESPVGNVIAEANLVGTHTHNWKNISAGGNGKPIVMGDGRAAAKVFSNLEVAGYLQLISGAESRETIAKYVAALQDQAGVLPQNQTAAQSSFVNESLIDGGNTKGDLSNVIQPKKPEELLNDH